VFEYIDRSPTTALDNLNNLIFPGINNRYVKNSLIYLVAEKTYYFIVREKILQKYSGVVHIFCLPGSQAVDFRFSAITWKPSTITEPI